MNHTLNIVVLVFLVFVSVVVANEDVVKQQHMALGLSNPEVPKYQHTDHPDAQWFDDGNLGLFLHWGLSSVNADNELSWAMLANINWNPNPIAPTKYWAQAKEFNPQKYDADKWIKAAKEAGFTYAILTTRHHDGFAMWPSKYGDLNIGQYADGVDLVKPFVDACHKYELKVGLYFSPRNWRIERGYRSYSQGSKGTPEKPHLDVDYKPTTLKKRDEAFEEKYRTINRGQLEELLTHYGKIDLLWFDGGTAYTSVEKIREWQPGIIINNRTNDVTADYDASFEGGHLPKERPAGWWEACQTAIGSWGYRKAVDDIATPASEILSQFVKLRAWGGNYLINFGPRADGTLPDIYYERMKEIGDWMAVNHKAVIGTQAGPYPQQCNVPVTTTDNIWYLFALPEFTEEKIVLTGVPKPKKVLFKCQEINYSFDETRIEIVLPKEKRSKLPDVVQIEW